MAALHGKFNAKDGATGPVFNILPIQLACQSVSTFDLIIQLNNYFRLANGNLNILFWCLSMSHIYITVKFLVRFVDLHDMVGGCIKWYNTSLTKWT